MFSSKICSLTPFAPRSFLRKGSPKKALKRWDPFWEGFFPSVQNTFFFFANVLFFRFVPLRTPENVPIIWKRCTHACRIRYTTHTQTCSLISKRAFFENPFLTRVSAFQSFFWKPFSERVSAFQRIFLQKNKIISVQNAKEKKGAYPKKAKKWTLLRRGSGA